MISVKNVSKNYRKFDRTSGLFGAVKDLFGREYKEHKAVSDLSFEVKKGSIVGFIGPNGAGKTTTIKMLTGIIHTTVGEIRVDNENPFEKRKKIAQNMGVVFGKRSNLMWDLPPEDGFNFLFDVYNVDKSQRERLKELLDIVDIKDIMHTPVRKLSLGQRTVCEVISAVLHCPKILFLDEPTIGLDLFTKEQVRKLIKYINKEWGVTVFLTTHDLFDIKELADDVIIISKGKKIYDGTLEDLMYKANYLPNAMVFKLDRKENNIKKLNMNGIIELTEQGTDEINITYMPSEIKKIDIINNVMKSFEVKDIHMKEIDIEDIIKHMYLSQDVIESV